MFKGLFKTEKKSEIEVQTVIKFETFDGTVLVIKRLGSYKHCKESANVLLEILNCKEIMTVQEVTKIYDSKTNKNAEAKNTFYNRDTDRFGIEASRIRQSKQDNESNIFGELDIIGLYTKRFDFQ
jgi:hypothetical protein